MLGVLCLISIEFGMQIIPDPHNSKEGPKYFFLVAIVNPLFPLYIETWVGIYAEQKVILTLCDQTF